MSNITPTVSGRGGQAVRDKRSGKVGITTGARAVRTPTIGVIFIGGSYDVRMQLDDLEPVKLHVEEQTVAQEESR